MSDVLGLSYNWSERMQPDWRDGAEFLETHMRWVETQRKVMRDNPRYFGYYTKGHGFHV